MVCLPSLLKHLFKDLVCSTCYQKKKKWRTRYIRHEASTSSGESDKKGRELMGEGTPQGERAGGRGWSLPVAHSVY